MLEDCLRQSSVRLQNVVTLTPDDGQEAKVLLLPVPETGATM